MHAHTETRAILLIYCDETTSKNRAVNHEYEKEEIINQQASVKSATSSLDVIIHKIDYLSCENI